MEILPRLTVSRDIYFVFSSRFKSKFIKLVLFLGFPAPSGRRRPALPPTNQPDDAAAEAVHGAALPAGAVPDGAAHADATAAALHAAAVRRTAPPVYAAAAVRTAIPVRVAVPASVANRAGVARRDSGREPAPIAETVPAALPTNAARDGSCRSGACIFVVCR